jgi:2-succinyl-6-hydroxy-2,4-cyclohexadiene-1-carboxylate synthase
MTSSPGVPDRLIFLHGFTQTHHHWHRPARSIQRRLRSRPAMRFVDLPGHGLAADDNAGIDEAADALPELAGAGTYVGYSMGARLALTATASGHAAVERLVLIGATPGIADESERARRVADDQARARHIEAIGVDAFLDEWLAAPMFSTLPVDASGLEHRRRNTTAGLAHSLRALGTGSQRPLWGSLSEIEIPVLVIAGGLDTKFVEIGQEMAGALPHATFTAIGDAGHAVHSERPDEVADVVAEWLVQTRPAAA